MPLYQFNADIKYPLSDFHETGIPNDILLDLSLSLPDDVEPVLGVVRTLAGSFFISIEDKSTQDPLASVYVPEVEQYTVYAMDMQVPGYGWVTTGPGVLRDYYSGGVDVDLAPEVATQLPVTGPVLKLRINGILYDIEDVLRVSLGSDMLTIQVQGTDTLIFSRNDNVLNDGDLEGLTVTDAGDPANNLSGIILQLGLATPDDNGNIEISVEGCIDNCDDTYKVAVPRGDTGLGEVGELPLDIYAPRSFLAGDPCAPSSYSAGSTAGYENCHNIQVLDILDKLDDHKVGIVFAPSY